ncbi:MAG TPA: ABC transporter permease [Firmicutes bacterium]|nr:ABC transporter permease [Candidatus Fermentithermobacillaceae bacterium]
MKFIWEGLKQAVRLILQGDPEILEIVNLTMKVSGFATMISVMIGIPTGLCLAVSNFRGRRTIISLVNAGMALPPTVAGLWVSLFLWRNGPLGGLRLMYTPPAMIIAQALIATPIVTGLTMAAVQQLNPKLKLQILALGASPLQMWWLLLRECRFGLMGAIMAGLGRVIAEVGASMAVGGNILHETRVLTTSIVLEIRKGNFDVAIALGFVLIALSYAITALLTQFQQKRQKG